MSKSFRFWVRCHTVALLCGLLIVNPVWAGRGLRCWLGHHQPTRCCPTEAAAACAQPAECCPEADVSAGSDSAAETAAIGQIVDPAPLNPAAANPAAANPVPVAPAPAAPASPAVVPEPKQSGISPIKSPETAELTRETLPVSTELQASQPEQNGAPPSPSVVIAEPAVVTEASPLPASPFDQLLPAEPAPVPPSAVNDDPFGAPFAPADPAVVENPFAPTTPTKTDAAAPSQPPALDDIFSSLSTPSATTAEPAVVESPLSPTTPSPAAPAEDPFGLPVVPATPLAPAAETSADDIFGAAINPKAQPSADGSQPVPSATERDDFLDLLTTAPAAPAPADVEPAAAGAATEATGETEEKAKPAAVEKADDDQASTVEPSDPLAHSPLRLWRDNTGNFEVTGRLAEVRPDHVRLLKENGRFTTVPMRRLSAEDRKYVELTIARIQLDQTRLITAE